MHSKFWNSVFSVHKFCYFGSFALIACPGKNIVQPLRQAVDVEQAARRWQCFLGPTASSLSISVFLPPQFEHHFPGENRGGYLHFILSRLRRFSLAPAIGIRHEQAQLPRPEFSPNRWLRVCFSRFLPLSVLLRERYFIFHSPIDIPNCKGILPDFTTCDPVRTSASPRVQAMWKYVAILCLWKYGTWHIW